MTHRLEDLIGILEEYIQFIQPYEVLLNTHNVQFINDQHWTSDAIIHPELRKDLDKFIEANKEASSPVPIINLVKYYSKFSETTAKKEPSNSPLDRLIAQLYAFHETWNRQVLTDLKDVDCLDQTAFSAEHDPEFKFKFKEMGRQNRFMNQKKIYEVDTMSIVVGKLCKRQGISTIVDIGSGKAYLSAQLSSPLFNYNVIAIDSSLSNVESSMKRLNVMKRKTRVFDTDDTPSVVMATSSKETEENQTKPPTTSSSSSFQTFSQFIQSSTELNQLIRSSIGNNFEDKCSHDDNYALVGLHSCGNLSNSIINLYLANSRQHLEPGAPAPANIKSNANSFKKLLCNVACCYNLLNEKYANDAESGKDLKHTNVNIDESSKFPISSHLNQKRYSLGFNIRMLACHSLDRSILSNLGDFKELNNVSLWYRCVLETILLDHVSSVTDTADTELDTGLKSGMQIGRKLIKEKTMPTFVEYVRKAFQRLAINNEIISDEKIMEYWTKYQHMKIRFDVYLQLKLLIAPIVEYIILLDRLVYLYEAQKSSDLAYKHFLVRIFDPAKSPRCHALISTVD